MMGIVTQPALSDMNFLNPELLDIYSQLRLSRHRCGAQFHSVGQNFPHRRGFQGLAIGRVNVNDEPGFQWLFKF